MQPGHWAASRAEPGADIFTTKFLTRQYRVIRELGAETTLHQVSSRQPCTRLSPSASGIRLSPARLLYFLRYTMCASGGDPMLVEKTSTKMIG